MTIMQLLALIGVFFFTSIIGVVTGSNSLITVPVMIQFGIDPRMAVATNMLALTFLSVGATGPFLGKGVIDRRRLPLLVALTLLGSILGALLLILVPSRALPPVIAVFMLAVAAFSFWRRNAGVVPAEEPPTRLAEAAGYALTFALGIYGGFFSGGYVTMLTAAYVVLFGMTFVEAVATTKVVNIYSSLIATVIFAQRGIIDYRLGIILSATMFIGAIIGARVTLKVSNLWLRRIFITTVVILALKVLFDFLQQIL